MIHIGSCWGIAPERTTLTEARKRLAGHQVWAIVASLFRRVHNG